MCRVAPDVCAGDRLPGVEPYGAVSGALDVLRAVNTAVNRAIFPKHDGVDRWTPDAETGDCEEYVLEKRRRLIALGWAPSQLLIAVAQTPSLGAHAVLIARTDQGDMVLDNLRDEVLPWRDTGLTFISRQSEKLPAMWVRL